MGDTKRVEFVDFKGFLDSARDMGLSFDDGVRELIDNSIDSGAQNVRVLFENTNQGGIKVTVEDDGSGIPLTFEDDDGVIKYGIPFIMAFGNKGEHVVIADGKRRRIGRFGYGLSTTITCLANEEGTAEIYTRRKKDPQWRRCYYKYSELIKDSALTLPPEEVVPFPNVIPHSDNGTIVVIEITDPEVTSVSHMQNRFLKFIGRTYKNHIADGLKVTISTKTAAGKESTKNVRIKDPLCLLPNSEEVEKFGNAIKYEPIIINFDGNNGFANHTLEDGRVPKITILLSRMHPSVVSASLEKESEGKSAPEVDKILERWNIGRRGQGFSLNREGRELETGETFGLYTKHPYFNYMHGSINFDSELDRLFNVRTNKSRSEITHKLRELIRENVEKTIAQIFRDHGADVKFEKDLKDKEGETNAEQIARELSPKLPVPQLSPQEIKKADEMREESKRMETDKATKIVVETLGKIFAEIEEKKKKGDTEGLKQVQLSHNMAQKNVKQWIERIDKRFSTRVPARIYHEVLDDGCVYSVEDRGHEAKIILNTESRFFPGIYQLVRSDEQLRTVLELMLMSLGYSEFIHLKDEPHLSDTWHEARREISTHLLEFVSEIQKEVN